MARETDQFYLSQEEPERGCFMALRELILAFDPEIKEAWKYGMPGFRISGKMLCYLWADKKTGQPYILWVKGLEMNHPELIQGDRKRMKIWYVDPLKDIDRAGLETLLAQARSLYP